jgi:hypothetical protein
MISARIRSFSIFTVVAVTGVSRTTLWRRREILPLNPDGGFMGMDVVRYMQQRRTEAGLPPPDEEAILASLTAVEDARAAKAAKSVLEREVAA